MMTGEARVLVVAVFVLVKDGVAVCSPVPQVPLPGAPGTAGDP